MNGQFGLIEVEIIFITCREAGLEHDFAHFAAMGTCRRCGMTRTDAVMEAYLNAERRQRTWAPQRGSTGP